ncbi:MAG: Cof-type HAD-IIB family hydrolase [Oscillospiraceae bacterium]|nr:Cof-type HAD-IIB family hydrolase [Oscillospiraceae bacterium]
MNTKEIKLIVTDLDNTLLRKDKTLSEYTLKVFEEVRKQGILLAFATARDFRFVTEYVSPTFGIVPDILISDNGALARYMGRDIYRKLIPSEHIREILEQYKILRCVSTEKHYYLFIEPDKDNWSSNSCSRLMWDISEDIPEDALYIDGIVGDNRGDFTQRFNELRSVNYSDVPLVTVIHHQASKLNALKAVIEELDIAPERLAVFGDDYSDIEMLSFTPNSVAAANAIEEVKRISNYHCGHCDEDGVARWIDANMLR